MKDDVYFLANQGRRGGFCSEWSLSRCHRPFWQSKKYTI